ncbi:MAG TPA: cytochrome P450, partial [Caulobacteraceae bacterium]|nr:cytochrome P450 [Caulobacteraceae bacterium]
LARSPKHQDLVRAEVQGFDPADPEALERLVWTRAVFEEAMRLFPPAPLFTRVALKETKIAGRRVPAGTAMLISPWVIHRHRRLWDDPSAFIPERFLPEHRERIDRLAYIPFGGGPRVCIGATFAMQEATIALATILRSRTLVPIDDVEPVPAHRITLRPKTHIRLKVGHHATVKSP